MPRILAMMPKMWFFILKGKGWGGERDVSQGPAVAAGESGWNGQGAPWQGELTPWSVRTVQMPGRACLNTSWTAKAWKPTARDTRLAHSPANPGPSVHPPLKRGRRETAANRRVRWKSSSQVHQSAECMQQGQPGVSTGVSLGRPLFP